MHKGNDIVPGFSLKAALMLAMVSAAAVPASLLTTSIGTRKLSVGDRVRFTVSAIVGKGTTITPPATESNFGTIVVKEWNLHKTERGKSDSCAYEYIITSYTPDPCTIPELSFILETGGAVDTLRTEAIPLQIISVLPSDTVDIMGLKPPLSAGKAPMWWLWLIGTLALAGFVTFGGIWLNRRLRKTPPPPPPVPPYEEAIEALSNLGVKKYLQRGLVREYVFELSEIFKRYIGRRFKCNAVEFTTEELVAWTGAADLPKKLRAAIEWFFRTTDPVKFARQIPDTPTLERFEREVRDFLEVTKPVEQGTQTPDGTITGAADLQPATGQPAAAPAQPEKGART
ncbi:MAG: hypothetical protein JW913_04175 [Chitinispirillaceae bacterium]|nr:hypothetical protein [Chitinispirillaceae bacterium]